MSVEFGIRLRTARRVRAMSVDRLALLSGLSASHVRNLECGDCGPSTGALVALGRALGVSVAVLLGERE